MLKMTHSTKRSTVECSIVLFLASVFVACGEDAESDTTPQRYDDPAIVAALNLPESAFNYANAALPALATDPAVTALLNAPADNPITDAGATLGRVLFYDPILSANGTRSCADCHQAAHGFSDPATLSVGFQGGATGRNSMSLINVAYYVNGAMFWDERSTSLEHQVLQPIQDPVEMGMTLDALIAAVTTQAYYPPLFEIAFGDTTVTSDRISRALSQFVRSIVSFNAPFDVGLAAANGNPNVDFTNFTAQENQGKTLFFAPADGGPGGPSGPGGPTGAGCAGCHADADAQPGPGTPVLLQMGRARNNGLALDTTNDPGLGAITQQVPDQGKFKSPSLRNVALTAPYMHDGSLTTLRDVIEHYNSGVQDHPNLDPILEAQGGTPRQLGLTSTEIDALVAFLQTLTDTSLASDTRFTNPFR